MAKAKLEMMSARLLRPPARLLTADLNKPRVKKPENEKRL
jgi:hypothetical protein